MYSTITRLSSLVYYSTLNYTEHVKSWLKQWAPWWASYRRYGPEIELNVSGISLRPSGIVTGYNKTWLIAAAAFNQVIWYTVFMAVIVMYPEAIIRGWLL